MKKIERSREGRVCFGFFHLWMTDPKGSANSHKEGKTLGPASPPKHEVQQKLADYISEYTGKLLNKLAEDGYCNPRKIESLSSHGIRVVDRIPVNMPANEQRRRSDVHHGSDTAWPNSLPITVPTTTGYTVLPAALGGTVIVT